MKLLMVGDIVGAPGRRAFEKVVEKLKKQGEADFVVANAENSAGGRGLTGPLAEEIFKAGADVITLGDHVWDRKELRPYLDTQEKVIRPANLAPGCPGRGMTVLGTDWGKVAVINLVGRVFMGPVDCPFRKADLLLGGLAGDVMIKIVDLHAEATSEKIVMGRYLAGRVSCVAGTHTHVQTSDEKILDGGTAYITDLGMTGPVDSALGRDLEQVTQMILSGMPDPFKVGHGEAVLEGIMVDVDRKTGRAESIRRIREYADR